jgi:hypothetical protein
LAPCRCLILLRPELVPECEQTELRHNDTRREDQRNLCRYKDRVQLLRRLHSGSFLIDYTVNRHFDIYAGVTVADQTGGLNSGFLTDNSVASASGIRIK